MSRGCARQPALRGGLPRWSLRSKLHSSGYGGRLDTAASMPRHTAASLPPCAVGVCAAARSAASRKLQALRQGRRAWLDGNRYTRHPWRGSSPLLDAGVHPIWVCGHIQPRCADTPRLYPKSDTSRLRPSDTSRLRPSPKRCLAARHGRRAITRPSATRREWSFALRNSHGTIRHGGRIVPPSLRTVVNPSLRAIVNLHSEP
jgi:hypothetical protein